MSEIFGNSMLLMKQSLDYLWTKQSVTSDNIANVDTPGFKAGYVTFEEEFKKQLDLALNTNNNQNIRNVLANQNNLQVHTSVNEGLRADGNNVNLDVEMIELSITSQQYNYALSSLNSDITRLSTVIKG